MTICMDDGAFYWAWEKTVVRKKSEFSFEQAELGELWDIQVEVNTRQPAYTLGSQKNWPKEVSVGTQRGISSLDNWLNA